MGYYASYNGSIKLKEDITAELIENGKYLFENFACVDKYIDFGGDGKYYGDDVEEYLRKITPYTDSGEIEYSGEDGCLWRFIFRDSEWIEQNGTVSYESIVLPKDKPEFIGQIVDVFDDEIDSENPVFTGERYDRIATKLEALMKAWKIFDA